MSHLTRDSHIIRRPPMTSDKTFFLEIPPQISHRLKGLDIERAQEAYSIMNDVRLVYNKIAIIPNYTIFFSAMILYLISKLTGFLFVDVLIDVNGELFPLPVPTAPLWFLWIIPARNIALRWSIRHFKETRSYLMDLFYDLARKEDMQHVFRTIYDYEHRDTYRQYAWQAIMSREYL